MNKRVPARLLLGLVSAVALCVAADDDPFEFALIGDNPYTPTAMTLAGKIQTYPAPAYNNLIADINAAQKLQFTVHAGDIKAGDTLCADNVYTTNRDLFNSFAKPVIFAPGDNEWTDCHRANNGGMNPIERLAFLRTTFYPDSLSLGATKLLLNRQSADPGMTAYVPHCPGVPADSVGCTFAENVMWTFGPAGASYRILFVTLNQPGSNNNHSRTAGLFALDTEAEYSARNAANMAWLNKAFDILYADANIKGLVIMSQANAFERYLEGGQGYSSSGYADFIRTVRSRARNQSKRILLVGGDTHYFRVDKPLTQMYPECLLNTPPCRADQAGVRLMNVTRTEVFAQTDTHWTKVKVEPKNPELFIIEPQTVPANVVVVP